MALLLLCHLWLCLQPPPQMAEPHGTSDHGVLNPRADLEPLMPAPPPVQRIRAARYIWAAARDGISQ